MRNRRTPVCELAPPLFLSSLSPDPPIITSVPINIKKRECKNRMVQLVLADIGIKIFRVVMIKPTFINPLGKDLSGWHETVLLKMKSLINCFSIITTRCHLFRLRYRYWCFD